MEKDLTGSYPIIIDGNETGKLNVSRDGLFWCFEANSQMCDEIIRLSVYGQGEEGYLGILEPSGETLCLQKKLSRTSLSGFPKLISHGGRRGETQIPAPPATINVPPATPEPCTIVSAEPEPEISDNCEIVCESYPLERDIPPPLEGVVLPIMLPHPKWLPCACPCSLFSTLSAKSLLGELTTALISKRDNYSLLAIPALEADALPDNEILVFSENVEICGFSYRAYKVLDGLFID